MTASGGRATARQESVDVEGAVRRALLCGDCGNSSSVVPVVHDSVGGAAAGFHPEMGGVRAEVIARLAQLVGLWRHYGRSMNLLAQHGAMESVERQLGESILVARLGHELGLPWRGASAEGSEASSLAEAPCWLDVGSGAGFPGLVVAAMLDVEVWLVEPRAKRATFLELALATIRGRGRVVRGRLESLAADVADARPSRFGFASARAVFSPEEWVAKATPWVKPGGWIVVEAHDDTVLRIPGAGEIGVAVEREVRVDAPPWSVRGLQRVGGPPSPGR